MPKMLASTVHVFCVDAPRVFAISLFSSGKHFKELVQIALFSSGKHFKELVQEYLLHVGPYTSRNALLFSKFKLIIYLSKA